MDLLQSRQKAGEVMLGIHKSDDVFYVNWLMAWFVILDNLFSILTFDYYYMDLTGRLFFGDKSVFEKSRPCSIKRRIIWCFITCIEILESIFVILTLGFLEANWVYCLFSKKEK